MTQWTPEQVLAAWQAAQKNGTASELEAGAKRRRRKRCCREEAEGGELEAGAKRRKRRKARKPAKRRRRARELAPGGPAPFAAVAAREDAPADLEAGARRRRRRCRRAREDAPTMAPATGEDEGEGGELEAGAKRRKKKKCAKRAGSKKGKARRGKRKLYGAALAAVQRAKARKGRYSKRGAAMGGTGRPLGVPRGGYGKGAVGGAGRTMADLSQPHANLDPFRREMRRLQVLEKGGKKAGEKARPVRAAEKRAPAADDPRRPTIGRPAR